MQRIAPLSDLFDNVIAAAEFRHQRYIIETSRSSRGWIILAVLMLLPGLITSLVVLGFALTNTDTTDLFASPISDTLTPLEAVATIGVVSMTTMNLALYPVVLLITVGLSANSISREKVQKTWEVLVLTNVNARQLILGKWWASLRALNGDHMMVLLLRLGIVGLIVGGSGDLLPPGVAGIPAHIAHTVTLVLLMAAFTALDAAFTAALGIAAALSAAPGVLTGSIILGIRVVGILFNFVYLTLIFLMMFRDGWVYLLMGLVGIVVGVLATWITLIAAQRIAVRGAVSAPATGS